MLKTNIKLWAIVVALCLIGQFFWAAVPGWIEKGKQEAQVEIAQREEERLALHEPGLPPVEMTPVETSPMNEQTNDSISIEKTNINNETIEEIEVSEDEKFDISSILPIFIIIIIVVFIFSLMLG